MPTKSATFLAEAMHALDINVPIYRFEIHGKTITLWLYGHYKPVKYTRRTPRKGSETQAKRAAA